MYFNNLIYLCGQITGSSYEEARFGWRQDVIYALDSSTVTCLSPMRAKGHLDGLVNLSKLGSDDPQRPVVEQVGRELSCSRGITTRDRWDVGRSSLIFANLDMSTPSVGSCIELGWADAFRVPVVAVLPETCSDGEPNPHYHAMPLHMIGWRLDTVAQAIETVKAILRTGL